MNLSTSAFLQNTEAKKVGRLIVLHCGLAKEGVAEGREKCVLERANSSPKKIKIKIVPTSHRIEVRKGLPSRDYISQYTPSLLHLRRGRWLVLGNGMLIRDDVCHFQPKIVKTQLCLLHPSSPLLSVWCPLGNHIRWNRHMMSVSWSLNH